MNEVAKEPRWRPARASLDKLNIASAGVHAVDEFLDHPVLTGRWHDVQVPARRRTH